MRSLQETTAERALVCNIQHFSLHDGPGIRTTVFFKGCNLRCAWCHNPESIRPEPQLAYDPRRCVGCGACAAVCPARCHRMENGVHLFDRRDCIGCMRCAQVCPSKALWVYGTPMDASQILEACLRDRELYEISGGGVTFSGGECLLRPELARALGGGLRAEGITLCVDTALNVPWKSAEELVGVANLFLVDFKMFSAGLHRKYTGADNARILENLRKLGARCPYWIRIPLVRGVNDTSEETALMAGFLSSLEKKPARIDLLRFHAMGEWKYDAIGWEKRPFEAPDDQAMRRMEEAYRAVGCPVFVT